MFYKYSIHKTIVMTLPKTISKKILLIKPDNLCYVVKGRIKFGNSSYLY